MIVEVYLIVEFTPVKFSIKGDGKRDLFLKNFPLSKKQKYWKLIKLL